MSIILPEIEVIEKTARSIRYLEHGFPDDLCRWHSHEEYEIHLITCSRGKAFVGDYIGGFKEGDLYLTGPLLPHNWVTDNDIETPIPLRDMLVQFHDRRIKKLLEAFPEFIEIQKLLSMSVSGIQFIGFDVEVATEYLTLIRDTQGTERILHFLKFLTLLNEHSEKTLLSVVQLRQQSSTARQTKLGEVVDHIAMHYSEELSVAQAADMAGMSPASFSRNFQLSTGNRFTEFVNRIRIGQACVMLFETDEQISMICYDVGFQNLANFNRHFHKMKGMTPTEYRNAARASLLPAKQRKVGARI